MRWIVLLVFILNGILPAQDKELIDHLKKVEKKQNKSEKLKPGWNNLLESSLTVTQTSYHNWQSGGSNVFVWMGIVDGSAIRDTSKYSWANYIKVFYGASRQNGAGTRKTNDLLELESVFSIKDTRFLNPYLSVSFRSQLTPGYNYSSTGKEKISDFFDPGYLVGGLGIGYAKDRLFRTRIGAASRAVFTNKYSTYADGNRIKYDAGLQWVSRIEKKLLDNILFKTKLDVFSTFEDFKEADLNWDTLLQVSVTQYIVINLQTLLIYDPKIVKKAQIKEILSIGLRYNFI